MVKTLLFQKQMVSNMSVLLLLFQDYVRVKFDVLKQSCVIIIQACLRKKKLMENLTAGNCFLHTWMTQKQLNGFLQNFTKNDISGLRQGMRNSS